MTFPPSAAFTLWVEEKKEGGGGIGRDLISEGEAAEGFGLSRQAVVSIREEHMEEGVHWRMEGRAIMLTKEGFELLTEIVGVPIAGKKVAPQSYTLTVVRLPGNRRLVLASDGQKRDLRVRVGNSGGFRPGMVLEGCKALDLAHGHYEFSGKPPRQHRR